MWEFTGEYEYDEDNLAGRNPIYRWVNTITVPHYESYMDQIISNEGSTYAGTPLQLSTYYNEFYSKSMADLLSLQGSGGGTRSGGGGGVSTGGSGSGSESSMVSYMVKFTTKVTTVAGTVNYFQAINNDNQIIKQGNDIYRNFYLSSFKNNQPMKLQKYIKNGGKPNKLNNFKKLANSGNKIAKVGNYLNYIGFGLSTVNLISSDRNWGDVAEYTISLTSIALTFTGDGAPLGIGIGLYDLFGGFDDYYQFLNEQEQLYNAGIPAMIGFSVGGVPIIIQKD